MRAIEGRWRKLRKMKVYECIWGNMKADGAI